MQLFKFDLSEIKVQHELWPDILANVYRAMDNIALSTREKFTLLTACTEPDATLGIRSFMRSSVTESVSFNQVHIKKNSRNLIILRGPRRNTRVLISFKNNKNELGDMRVKKTCLVFAKVNLH